MSTKARLREEQHEKLRALIQPLGNALRIEPAGVSRTDEAEIWDEANGLYQSLIAFFDEMAGAESDQDAAAEAGTRDTISALLEDLSTGKCPGVKGATAYKIQKFAAERGYV